MYAVSFDKEALNMKIHNLYPDLGLTYPIYCSNGTICRVSFSQQMDRVEAGFGIAFRQKNFKGVLLCKLQRKHAAGTDNQHSSTAPIEDIAENICLLVVWNVRDHDHGFRVCLIECDDDFAWDEDKLWALYFQYNDQFRKGYKSNINAWLIHDNAVMKTKCDTTYGADYKLDIIISEGARERNVEEPIKIDTERLVLS
jgi:hypothetical protein